MVGLNYGVKLPKNVPGYDHYRYVCGIGNVVSWTPKYNSVLTFNELGRLLCPTYVGLYN